MRYGKLAFILIALCLGGTLWAYAGSPNSTSNDAAVAACAEAQLTGDGEGDAALAGMSAGVKTAQARCPPGQLVFLTNACGCNGACCACSAQAPYLDHCSCRCSATPPTTCNRGFSAGRR